MNVCMYVVSWLTRQCSKLTQKGDNKKCPKTKKQNTRQVAEEVETGRKWGKDDGLGWVVIGSDKRKKKTKTQKGNEKFFLSGDRRKLFLMGQVCLYVSYSTKFKKKQQQQQKTE